MQIYRKLVGIALVCVMLLMISPTPVRADHLIMEDGTIIEGMILTQGEKYWVKKADGTSQVVLVKDVKKLMKGSPAPAGAAATGTPAATAGTAGSTPSIPTTTADIASVKRRMDAVENPMTAVTGWQKYIESKPSATDLKTAKAEQAKWQKMADDRAEKVNGKWVFGDALKELHTKVRDKLEQAFIDMESQKTLQALKTLEEVRKMYPKSFEANFWTGYMYLLEHKDKDAISYLEAAVKISPDDHGACNNLGIALFATRTDLARGILMMHHSVEIEDTQHAVNNLVMSLSMAPREMQYNEKLKPAYQAARLLASTHGVTLGEGGAHGGSWMLIGPSKNKKGEMTEGEEIPGAGKRPAGASVASGTGFVINEDGLILTNRHVVEGGTSFMVILNGNDQKVGEVVMIDADQDLALIRIKPDAKLPIATFSADAKPAEGAACFAMGFPLIDRMGASIKVTQGIVSGVGRAGVGADVVIDAKVNPGNSGGPLLDKYGRVIGIITMKTRGGGFEDSYGLAIGTSRIREFLTKNKVKVSDGAAGATALNAEEVAAKMKPATVCIISVREK